MRKITKVLLLATIVVLASCGSSKVYRTALSKIGVEHGTIPPKFIKKDEVLLIKNLDEELKQEFIKYYKGKHVFVSFKAIETIKKYQDLNTYPYIFDFDFADTGEYGKFHDFFLLDRKENKKYRTGFSSSDNKMVVKAYAKKMEEIRLNNVNFPETSSQGI